MSGLCAAVGCGLTMALVLPAVPVRAAVQSSPAGKLSPAEQQLVHYIEAHNDEALTLLERVVNINSGTQNLQGVRAVGDIFRSQFDTLGFKTRWVDGSAFHRAGHLVANIVVVLDGDEEEPGQPLSAARAALVDAAKGTQVAIGFEDADGNPKNLVIARRGASSWYLRVTGTTAHSSQIFQPNVGAGAVFEAARILNGFREKLAGQPHLTFNPGLMLGGTQAEANNADARGTAFGETNVIADLAFDEGYPPLAPTDGNRKLFAAYSQASEDLGAGLKGHDDHSPKETADLRTLPTQTERTAVLLARLTAQ